MHHTEHTAQKPPRRTGPFAALHAASAALTAVVRPRLPATAFALAALPAIAAMLVLAAPASAATKHLYETAYTSGGFPYGLAVDGSSTQTAGDIYVSSLATSHVEVLDSAGASQGAITGCELSPPGERSFEEPDGLAVDPASGDLYVVDSGRRLIDKFAYKGNPGEYECVAQLSGTGAASGTFIPINVAVDPSNSNLYVAGFYIPEEEGEEFHDVVEVYSSSGTREAEYSVGAANETRHPGVAVDSAGNFYVAQEGVQQVEVFTSSGSHLRDVALSASRTGAIAVDPSSGDLYVDESDHVAEFGPSASGNEPLEEFGHGHVFGEAGSYAIAVSAAGTAYTGRWSFKPGENVAVFPLFTVHGLAISLAGTGTGEVKCEVEGGPAEACEADYREGTHLALVATPGAHSTFAGFSEDCTGLTCELTIEADTSVTATFGLEKLPLTVTKTGTGTGTVTSTSPASPAIDCGAECSKEYEYGTTVKLKGAPGAHTAPVQWSGCDTVNGSGECEVSITAAKGVSAGFGLEKFPLTVTKSGSGTGTVESTSPVSPKLDCGAECSKEYEYGTTVKLKASAGAHTSPVQWGGCDTVNGSGECEVSLTAAKGVSAGFGLEKLPLTVTKSGTGTGAVESTSPGSPKLDCGAECSKEYEYGTTVKLKASAGAHTSPVQWSGCDTVNGGGECEVAVTAVKAVTATFGLEKFPLTVTRSGTGTGSVACNGAACASAYEYGTEITLTASASPGSSFAGFSGAGCSGAAGCAVAIQAATAVTATFTANPLPPAVEKCLVPKLAGISLGKAKSALRAAHCALGRVTKPKRSHGALVVRSSKPGAGTTLPAGSKVNLKLGPKPKKRH